MADCRTYTIEALTGSEVTVVNPHYWGGSYWGGSYWGGSYWGVYVYVSATPTERTLTVDAETRTFTIDGLTYGTTVIPVYGETDYGDTRYGIDSDPPAERTLTVEC